jgi:hypothetical protein
MADEHDVGLDELRAAVGALRVAVGSLGLGELARVPTGTADTPRHDVLETAKDSRPLTRRLVRAKAVTSFYGRSAPGARD